MLCVTLKLVIFGVLVNLNGTVGSVHPLKDRMHSFVLVKPALSSFMQYHLYIN